MASEGLSLWRTVCVRPGAGAAPQRSQSGQSLDGQQEWPGREGRGSLLEGLSFRQWTRSLDVLRVSRGEVSESTCPVAAQTSATRTSLWGQICSCCQVILTKAVSHGLRGSEFQQLAAAHSDAAHSGGPLRCEGCGKTQDLPGAFQSHLLVNLA